MKNFYDFKLKGYHLLHNHILTPAYELIFSLYNGLQKLQIFHMAPMDFNAMHKMLNDLVVDLTAQGQIILEYCTYRFGFQNL